MEKSGVNFIHTSKIRGTSTRTIDDRKLFFGIFNQQPEQYELNNWFQNLCVKSSGGGTLNMAGGFNQQQEDTKESKELHGAYMSSQLPIEFLNNPIFKELCIHINKCFPSDKPERFLMPREVYVNAVTLSDVPMIHRDIDEIHEEKIDGPVKRCYTTLIYLNPDMGIDSYGETVWFDEEGDAKVVHSPKQYTFVSFNGHIQHRLTPPSRDYVGEGLGVRYTLAVKWAHLDEIEKYNDGWRDKLNHDMMETSIGLLNEWRLI